jgi:protein-disulfide isomerase
LVSQVREGKTRAQVEVAYKERFSPDTVADIDVDGSPAKGAPTASITIVEWADFECPACQAAVPVLNQFVKDNDDVRLVFKNFPLDIHENAEYAARAAMAADLQGKFWEMHKGLFSSQMPLTESTILQIAEDLEFDMEKFKKDQRSEAVADAVARDRKQGEKVKLRATPTLYINGRLFSYGTDLKAGLEDWVQLERKLVPPAKTKPKTKKTEKPGDEPGEAVADAKPVAGDAKEGAPVATPPQPEKE